jgi:hypothetical protein
MNIAVLRRCNVGGGRTGLWEHAGHQVERLGRAGGNVIASKVVMLAVPGTAVQAALSSVTGLQGKTVLDVSTAAVSEDRA